MLGRRPNLVVDLGSGTGLSTFVWENAANHVIGIEPNEEMRARAQAHSQESHMVEFREGDSGHTGLPDGSVDIVVSTSALHWMDPKQTLPEVARILCDDGIMAGIKDVGCPTVHPAVELAYHKVTDAADRIWRERDLWPKVPTWPLQTYFTLISESGLFSYTKEIFFHDQLTGNADRFVGWARSVGVVRGVLREGVTEEEIELPQLRQVCHSVLGDEGKPWHISYRMIVGIKHVEVGGV